MLLYKTLQISTNRLIHIILMCITYISVHSQSMSVASFVLDEKDLTANAEGSIKYDLNGDKCALIKIETTEHNFSFDVGSIGITEVISQNAQHPGEIWLYVPHGVKSITIQHPIHGIIRDYDLGQRVKKGKTYILKLTSEQVSTMVVDYNNSQYLRLNVYPNEAKVFINGVPMTLSSQGTIEIPLAFGTHNYRISATNYHTEEGQISIYDKEQKQTKSIRLKQAFGYVNILSPSADFEGADIYIDEDLVGKLPIKGLNIKSGKHKITITKDLYFPFSDEFSLTDSAFVDIMPTFVPNYANVTVTSVKDAQIFDNGILLGTGKWQGRLEAGEHIIEAKKIGHKTTSTKLSFAKGENRMVSIESPIPIYGSVEITSVPTNAEVYIDGVNVGQTPYISSKILVGEHKIQISREGYKTEVEIKEFDEHKTIRINKKLTDFCNATINTNTPANVFIDGTLVGTTPYEVNVVAGIYDLGLKAKGYSNFSKRIKLDGSTKDINLKLHKNYINKFEGYLHMGYNPIGFNSWSVGVGCYLWNFGLEFNYLGGIGYKETLYWSDGECMPRKANYKPNGFNIKLGYGIRLNSRMRLTPQIGIQNISYKENLEDYFSSFYDYTTIDTYDNFIDGANTTSLTLGCKLNIVICRHLGVSISPEYYMPVKESEGHKIFSEISSTIKNISSGFNCSINLNLFF